MKLKKADIILAIGILIVVFISYMFIFFTKEDGEVVVISVDNKEYARCPLSENKRINVKSENGENIVVIDNGSCYVESASCPDKICVKHSKIKYHNDVIACVPNKVIVEIKSDKDNKKVDTIAK